MGKGLTSSQGPSGGGTEEEQWSEDVGSEVGGGGTGHSLAALARRPLHGHPSHHPGPAGKKPGQRGPSLAGMT